VTVCSGPSGDELGAKPPGEAVAGKDIVRGPAEVGGHSFPFVEEHFGSPHRLIVAQARDAGRTVILELGERGSIRGKCRNRRNGHVSK
jgi:hypothetical protein